MTLSLNFTSSTCEIILLSFPHIHSLVSVFSLLIPAILLFLTKDQHCPFLLQPPHLYSQSICLKWANLRSKQVTQDWPERTLNLRSHSYQPFIVDKRTRVVDVKQDQHICLNCDNWWIGILTNTNYHVSTLYYS